MLLGGRELPPWFTRVVVLMAPTLLCALVVTSVFASGRSWSVGAHTVGVAVAAVMLWRRLSAGALRRSSPWSSRPGCARSEAQRQPSSGATSVSTFSISCAL